MTDRVLNQQTAQQTEDDVRVLEGLQAVRVSPTMYIPGVDIHGLHHLVYEVVDNALDEIMAGRADRLLVTIHNDGSLSVNDNGGGIPVGIHRQKGISTLELVMTQLNAGSKFNDGKTKTAYKVSGGMYGIGVSAVNALSSHLEVQVRREGKVWQQIYECGKPITGVELIREMDEGEATGTSVRFHPDLTILQTGEFIFETLAQRFREMAYVTRGAAITLIDLREQPIPREMTFCFEGGVRSFVRFLDRNRDAVHDAVGGLREDIVYNEGTPKEGMMSVEFAFQYTEGTSSSTELSFANHINTRDGGTHQTGLRMALTRAINTYARKQGFLKEKDANFSGRDTLEGLTAIVSIRHPSPQLEGQTKGRLLNPEVQSVVASVVTDVFGEYLEVNPREGRRIVEKCMNSMRIRDALEKQRELLTGRKSLLENTTLPGKLADCSERDPSKCEIYLVEGDSAGGSAKQGRDRHFQAILPLRGKILNTERARLNKILDSNEIKAIISALGVGISDDFNLEKLRYDRTIIMTDADHDGNHIRTLLLTFFFRYMQPLVQGGHLYIAQPPIFRLEYKKQPRYYYPEAGLGENELLTRALADYADPQKVTVSRYKGLGEMNPQQLWETTMDPGRRTLLRVTIDDAAEADRVFDMLMGSEVPPRRRFITTHARNAKLDV
ncbi:MAG: DNA gyrase/topoisomerase IV subunit B [Aggregatilineales bacterium]